MGNTGINISVASQAVFHRQAVPADNGSIFYIDLSDSILTSAMFIQFSQTIKEYSLQIHSWFVCKGEKEGLRLCVKIY